MSIYPMFRSSTGVFVPRLHGILPKKVSYRLIDDAHSVKCLAVLQATSSRKMSDIEHLDETNIEDLASIHFPNIAKEIRQSLLERGRDKDHIIRWSLEVIHR